MFQLCARPVLVAAAADKKLGLAASLQAAEIVGASFYRRGWKTQSDDGIHAGIGAGSLNADGSAKGKSGKNYGAMKLCFQPIEGGANVVYFASSLIVLAFT